jgi:hypothetical protein
MSTGEMHMEQHFDRGLLLLVAFFAPSFIGLPVVFIIVRSVPQTMAAYSSVVIFAILVLFWIAVDTIRPRLLRWLLAGVSLLLVEYLVLEALRFQAWWALGVGGVFCVIVMAVGAQRAERRT